MKIDIFNGDCLEVLKKYPDNYFHSVVTDPPYGISFMQKKWDYDIPSVEIWSEIFRVLKHGGHVLCACGTRTQHRMVVNIEDAGFEIRDVITWHYGSGFPKSHDISKAIDKQKGTYVEGELSKNTRSGVEGDLNGYDHSKKITLPNPQSDDAKKWSGWGTALKPATEFFTLARKPLLEDTVAENVMKHGVGGINIDSSRIATDDVISNHSRSNESAISKGKYGDSAEQKTHQTEGQKLGRFPANVIFDDFTGEILDEQSGNSISKKGNPRGTEKKSMFSNSEFNKVGAEYNDEGGASRFFYCAKPSKAERNKGVQDGNKHPTVKPIKLMQYLVKLITPTGGIVLDPFNGSGTTGIACKIEGFDYIGIEREKESCDTSIARIAAWDIKKTPDEQLELF